MTPLRETTVPFRRTEPQKPRGWNPLALFTDRALAAKWWCLVALIAAGFCAVQPFLVIRAYRQEERVVVMDAAGTFHVSPLIAFEDATKLHEQCALLACLALLQRNPSGPDFPELLEKMFLPEAAKKAKDSLAATSAEFAAKTMHQKPEVLKLTVLASKENTVLVQAEGQLVRAGLLGGQAFTEAPTFIARFTFARNPNLAANGRFPLAVWSYELSQ